jgi:hypothetical protein
MQIDLEHLHYWMQAIRQSNDPVRTMDAFWSGQLRSKEWLIQHLRPHVLEHVSIDIHGGWVGVLASMIFQSTIPVKNIRSVDIDPTCEPIATTMNKGEEIVGKFSAITADMCSIQSDANVVINTSCEHISQKQYDQWLDNMPNDSLFVVQSNNYEIPEHVRTAKSLEEFNEQSKLSVLWQGELELPMYTRYMIIGNKK